MDKQISISAADPAKYYWMRYKSERATSITINGDKQRIVKGDLFGVRELRDRLNDEVLLQTGQRFKLAIKLSEQLMNKSSAYRGQVKLKTGKPAAIKPAAAKQSPQDKKYVQLVKGGGLTVANFKRILPTLSDDAERLDFKRWLLSKLDKSSAKYRAVQAFAVGTAKTPTKIVVMGKRKAKITKLSVPTTQTGPVRVKLSEVEMPEEDEFHDHELPEEFRRFATSESGDGGILLMMAEAAEAGQLDRGTLADFKNIVKSTIEPHVRDANAAINDAVRSASGKVRAWAAIHLAQAKKFGKNTVLFEKLVNNPEAAVKQLAFSMLNIKPASERAAEKKAEEEMEDLLATIRF